MVYVQVLLLFYPSSGAYEMLELNNFKKIK